ncbi:unnamed protein product [Peronospora belbahrii]|uniref:PH domain-containing protein n=1 Tax=Peronospora belbahrii TaxID=622444 RepID=A0ABN8D6R1_9STRA|nr:unnamed protein product [Peronospora belbahrii]
MASKELLFSGQFMALTTDEMHTSLVRSLLDDVRDETAEGVWLYVKCINFPNAKYLAILDRPGFGNSSVEVLLYSILASLSSVVVHHVDGHLTTEAVKQFSFLASNKEDGALPNNAFPQSPKLLWVLQNVTINELKEQMKESGLSRQETEQTYLCNALAALPKNSPEAALSKLFESVFPDQNLFVMPPRGSETFEKQVGKLSRLFTDSIHNRYHNKIVLNGPLVCSIAVSMLAHRENVFKVFEGQAWNDMIHNCCLNVVKNGVKLYKLLMSDRLGSIVDTSDLEEFEQALDPDQERREFVELPCEHATLLDAHDFAKRKAKAALRTMPVLPGKLSSLLKRLFCDLVGSVFASVQNENNRISSELCQSLLTTLHAKMTDQVDKQLISGTQNEEDSYFFQSTKFRRFYRDYQTNLFEFIAKYTDQAKGPVKIEELAKFMHSVIRPQLAEFSERLEKIRKDDVNMLEEGINEKEEEVEKFSAKQKIYQKKSMDAQDDINRQLVGGAKLHALRKEALIGAIDDLTRMHEMATKQKELLEKAAFVSVQLPEQKVIEAAQDIAAQDKEVTEFQGYLIKQGGGGNVLNLLGRKNWKQRYFILIGASLIYAKTKDDYERGKIIKELSLTGCRVDPSRDAGEGFNITPGKSAHVFVVQRGLFEKNSKKRSSAVDSGRVFKLRAQNIQERDVWIDKLRQAAGGY